MPETPVVPEVPEIPEIPETPADSNFAYGFSTSPGDSVDIDYLFDIAGPSIFAPYIEEEEEEDPLAFLYTGYADGGIVQDSDIEELIRFLADQRG